MIGGSDQSERSKDGEVGDSYSAWLTNPADLTSLITLINEAVSDQNTALALRLADRAWRLAPGSSTLCQIAMSLQLQSGDVAQALRIVAGLPTSALTADLAALHVDALRLSGTIPEAEERLEQYFARFAVEPEGALAAAATALIEDSSLAGWIGVTPDMHLVGRLRCTDNSDTILLSASAEGQEDETIMIPASGGWGDDAALGNIAAVNGMRLHPLGKTARLIGGTISIPEHFGCTGMVGREGRHIVGSLRIDWLPRDFVPSLLITRREGEEQVPLTSDAENTGSYSFSIPVSRVEMLRQPDVAFHAALPDGSRMALVGSPLSLKGIKPYRAPRRAKAVQPQTPAGTAIVIPIYRGVEETSACIESVLWTTDEEQPIILVNDASPDPDMRLMLATYADDPRITLIHNERNLGFPGAANRGIAAAPDHDIIILNADTQVFQGWAERLAAHARADPSIATVTPLCNAGSIASYPGGKEAPCDEQTARQLDVLAAQVNAHANVAVPTGVGFCMFLRRASIDQVGGFDEELFARGYGEENDFCLRASAHGWKNVVAGDVFVLHHNGVSFGPERDSLMLRNGAVLAQRHPDYDDLVEALHKEQPLIPLRRALDIARLRKDKRPIVLLLSLALKGGVGRHVDARVEALRKQGLAPLVLRPDTESRHVRISAADAEAYPDLLFRFNEKDDRILFVELLRALPIHHVELHHFLGMDENFVETCLGLDKPVDIYIHDYSWYCPRLSLLGTQGVYCGEPGLASCESCIRQAGSELNDKLAPDALRARSLRWLRQARTVFAPCADVVSRYGAAFPDVALTVIPWEESPHAPLRLPPPDPKAEVRRIAVIGAIGAQKGQSVLLACARHAALHDLPLEFVLIGFAEDEAALISTGKVFVTGYYEPEELPALLAREAPSGIFLPSVTPETWSYTLSEALSTGRPIMAFDMGAIAERLRASSASYRLIPLETGTAHINELLMTLGDEELLLTEPAPAPPHTAVLPTVAMPKGTPTPPLPTSGASIMRETDKSLTSSAEFLSLPRGLYHFSAAPTGSRASAHPASLPALQVAIAPGQSHNDIECVSSPGAEHLWLCNGQDSVILKVNKDNARVVVILLTTPGLTPLQIDVRKLDGEQGAYAYDQPGALARQNINGAPPSAPPGATLLRSQIVVHAEFVGDVIGMDQAWAGAPTGGRAIECLTITPITGIAPAMIEYMAVSATGQETPWVDQGRPCGSRGMALPLSGFAIRQKAHTAARFACEYSGRFSSGRIVGPLRDGEMCRSLMPNDRLEAIWFHIVDQAGHAAIPGVAQEQRRAAGSRFSIFREIEA